MLKVLARLILILTFLQRLVEQWHNEDKPQ